MEIIPEGKHFRLLQDHELPELLETLEQYLPEALKFQQTIKTYLNDRVWQFYFYVSKNWPDDPICLHFPGCTSTPNNRMYESIGIFCPSERIECIEVLADETVLIDWMEPLYLNFTHRAIMEGLDKFYHEWGTMEKLCGDIYVCQKPPDFLELENLPSDEVEMRSLSLENAKAIHDLYPASEIECVEIFEKLIEAMPGYGIFCLKTGELAAWMVHSYYGAMFSMQTKPEFRRKGYGIHLAQALTKKVIERGYQPFVVIRPENDASRSLYMKLGFEKAYETIRGTLRPDKMKQHNGETHSNGVHANGDDEVDVEAEDQEKEITTVVQPQETDGQNDEGIEDMNRESVVGAKKMADENDLQNDEGIEEEDAKE